MTEEVANRPAAQADRADDTPARTARRVLSAPPRGAESSGYRLADDVFLVMADDGTGRLVDLGGSACAITSSGAAMLEMVLGRSFESAAADLAERFPSSVAQARSDMEGFLLELSSEGFLIPAASTKRSSRSFVRSISWLIAPIPYLCAVGPRKLLTLKAWVLLTASYLSTRLFGWPNTVMVWQACAFAGYRRKRSQPSDDPGALDAIDAIVRRTIIQHPLNLGCKERALCCQALARSAALPARIVLGVDLFPFALHCWCESGSRIVADSYEGRCDRYTPLAVYV